MRTAAAAMLVLLAAAGSAGAQEFFLVGSRSLAMGRSGVASVSDASAVYTNPAALASTGFAGAVIPVLGAGAFSPVDIRETRDLVDDFVAALDEFQSSPNAAAAQRAVDSILALDDDLVAGAEAHSLVALTLPIPLTLSYSERVLTDVRIVVDKQNISTVVSLPLPTNSIVNNESAAIGHVAWLRQVGLSYAAALPFLGENLLVGATGIIGHATTFNDADTLINLATGGEIDWRDRLRSNRESSCYLDLVVGAQAHFFERRLVAGITAAHLLSPTIERRHAADFDLDPQVRLGIAFSPFYEEHYGEPEAGEEAERAEGTAAAPRRRGDIRSITNPLTFTFDLDLTSNESALEGIGIESRHIGGGVEYAPLPWLALRAGVYRNLEESDLGTTITAGFQLSVLEIAGAYSLRSADDLSNEMRVSVGLSVTF
ncbi:MAG: conjugal transfer protein TraF [Planctomycetes bacterium]|nr:conjugal transfer protein TraF [Planctomycetota bacterium]